MTKRDKGFTLIELMIVVSIIGILAGVAVPRIMDAIPDISLKSAANSLAADLKLARIQAVKRREQVRVVIDPATNSYTIVTSGANTLKTVSLASRPGGIVFGVGAATKDAKQPSEDFTADFNGVSFTNNKVSFSQNGRNGNNGYIYLTNKKKTLTYAVGINNMVGFVRIAKAGRGDKWIDI